MVLDSLAALTQTELAGLDQAGNVIYSTTEVRADELGVATAAKKESTPTSRQANPQRIRPKASSTTYRVNLFRTQGGKSRQDGVASVAVLFDEQRLASIRRRAVIWPLATGISTILTLTSLSLLLTNGLIKRIRNLQSRVERVADGDFQPQDFKHVDDEIGGLGAAVDSMAAQLNQLWRQIHRQQGEKLLHQIAGGMAHQLRNSLTGARMAVELHARDCSAGDDEGIRVAINEIERSEDYVRRLLLAASGRQDQDRPTELRMCVDDIRSSLSPIAEHLHVDLRWDFDHEVGRRFVKDGPTWSAAATNLIQNAMQAGDQVSVALQLAEDGRSRLRVCDNGSGVSESVTDDLFEPFVTSKPEGMGLGLPVVRRAAEQLGGEVRWHREGQQTIFELDCATTAP
jgi:signal transduction histidine kinase